MYSGKENIIKIELYNIENITKGFSYNSMGSVIKQNKIIIKVISILHCKNRR